MLILKCRDVGQRVWALIRKLEIVLFFNAASGRRDVEPIT
jgi:hypothetical protein